MRVIYKYQIPAQRNSMSIDLPESFEVVHVGTQNGLHIALWILLDEEADLIPYIFSVRGTGQHVTDDEEHVGSVIMPPYVWHVFYKWDKS